MSFTLEQIDRAIEWHINDEMILIGLLPDKRAYLATNNISGYDEAHKSLSNKVEVFGVGNYKDREQLKVNNIIISRLDISDGEIGFNGSYFNWNELANKYDKIYSGEGTNHIQYEIRFVCDNVGLERTLTTSMLKLFSRREYMKGIVDETLAETDESFLITKPTPSVDLSTDKYIEKVMRILVNDVNIYPETVIDQVVAVTEIDVFVSPNIEDIDQIADDWSTDKETANINITMPIYVSSSIELGNANDILINFDKEITIISEDKGLPFSVTKGIVDITSDIVSIVKTTSLQLTITMGTAFINGDNVSINYERELEIGEVVGSENVEIGTIKNISVTNNL